MKSAKNSTQLVIDCNALLAMLAPTGTPREIVTKLHGAVIEVLKDPGVRNLLINDGSEPVGTTPEEFAAFIKSETVKWARVVREAGIGEK